MSNYNELFKKKFNELDKLCREKMGEHNFSKSAVYSWGEKYLSDKDYAILKSLIQIRNINTHTDCIDIKIESIERINYILDLAGKREVVSKKCPVCELNYIKCDDEACAVCKPTTVEQFIPKMKTEIVRKGRTKGKVTEEMVLSCYEYAKRILKGQSHINDAATAIVAQTKMNETTCKRNLDSIGGLLEGRKYVSVMSYSSTVLVLENIRSEHGKETFKTALMATELHLDYYEQVSGNKQRQIRDYVNQQKRMSS